MPHHAIVAFPESGAIQIIERLRYRYDPQSGLIPAHITLVFPFSDDALGAELGPILRATVGAMSAIELELDEVVEAEDEYVFLNVGLGREALVSLHDLLYRGRLSKHLSQEHIYAPHVTLGRLRDSHERRTAVAESRSALPLERAVVRSLSVFRLESPTRGKVVASIGFGGGVTPDVRGSADP